MHKKKPSGNDFKIARQAKITASTSNTLRLESYFNKNQGAYLENVFQIRQLN